ncbi:hypothetical protein GGU10DRAFT_382298 [Lentinula aff. detonsa]|uniref:MFS general substrate transporter n=1 Tax=Lentinula aff. detonsa TaxID=2804958 RepID=A0AA38NIS7_9AGAR|nr:hypothetical protein GGU10DRAFT_382298 [Lentinula aff. detonsa]
MTSSPSTPSLQNEKASETRLEEANEYDFGGESQLPRPPILSEEEERKLWRKIDFRLMPILCVMYLMSFMDRGNIGTAFQVTRTATVRACIKQPRPWPHYLNKSHIN